MRGVARYGVGNWRQIHDRVDGFNPCRRPSDLKDKWTNLQEAKKRKRDGDSS